MTSADHVAPVTPTSPAWSRELLLPAAPLRWRLHHADALELLALLGLFAPASVDAVITDPPYCSGGFSETGKRRSKGMTELAAAGRAEWFAGDNMGTSGLVWCLRMLAVLARRVLVPGGSLLVFCDWRMVASLAPALESVGLRHQQLVVWDKGSPGMGNGFRPRHELVLHFVKGTGRFHTKSVCNVIHARRVPPGKRIHPTEKPVALLEELVRVVTPKGGLVVDPFAGSGSSGEAALGLGRRWVGVELSGGFCARIRRRLEGAPLPEGGLFAGVEGRADPRAESPTRKE